MAPTPERAHHERDDDPPIHDTATRELYPPPLSIRSHCHSAGVMVMQDTQQPRGKWKCACYSSTTGMAVADSAPWSAEMVQLLLIHKAGPGHAADYIDGYCSPRRDRSPRSGPMWFPELLLQIRLPSFTLFLMRSYPNPNSASFTRRRL
jgi:hypothetical protein